MEAAGKGSKAARRRKAKKERKAKERGTGHSPEECPVCMTVFDDTVRRPCTLPCGHTVCTLCVNKLKQQGHVACPECRVSHAVPEEGQFPICYAFEAFIRRMGDDEKAATASPPLSTGTGTGVAGEAGQKEASGLSRKMRSFLQEQEASVVAAITACQEVQAQLDQYQTTLTDWGKQQQQLEDKFQGLLDESRNARKLVQQEASRATAKKEEAKEGERQLNAALESLRTPAAEQEARGAVAEALRCTFEAKEVMEECRGSFPDVNTATIVRKVGEASNAALEAFQAAMKAFQEVRENHPSVTEKELQPQSEEGCTIVDRLQAILTPSLKKEQESPKRAPSSGGVFLEMDPAEELVFSSSQIGVTSSIFLTNPSSNPLAIRIMTTVRDKYTVRPAVGVLEGDGQLEVQVTMGEQLAPSAFARDKFLVMATPAPKAGLKSREVLQLFKSVGKDDLFEAQLRVNVAA